MLLPPSNDWDRRFLQLAAHVAGWSKDPSTKVGAVIADGKQEVSLGYNGFPSRTPDNPETLADRLTKYPLIVHAEMNAILKARRSVEGLTLYVTLSPCSECAKLVAAAGIARVVTFKSDYANGLKDSIEKAKDIFRINNIEYTEYGK